jgi:hypothetical protein
LHGQGFRKLARWPLHGQGFRKLARWPLHGQGFRKLAMLPLGGPAFRVTLLGPIEALRMSASRLLRRPSPANISPALEPRGSAVGASP